MLIQTMENNEEILQALHEFENMSNAEKFLTQDLEDMLSYIAKTGRVLFPWNSLKPVFLFKLDKVMREFFESSPSRNATSSEPTVTADFEVMRQRLLDCLDSFTSAPFTIQRLCELMVEPRKNYSNSEKFMRGVEKNVLVVSTVDIGRDDISVFSLTNDVDVQHRLLNVPNGPVTNGVMTYAIPTEGNTVTDHSYDERLNPHVTPDSVTSHVTSDTTGSTLLTTKENGHSSQEHCNGGNSFTRGEESNQPAQQLNEEKSETVAKNDQGQVEWEEAPEKESKEDLPESNVTESLAEQKESTSQEEEQLPTSEQKAESNSEDTSETAVNQEERQINEEEPMDQN